MRNAFAIYHTWPDLRNAEYEVLQRILGAARNVGCGVVVIDNSGKVIWSTPSMNIQDGSRLKSEDVDFAISLHFESPRVCDVYTYYAVWQPIKFYEDFGYQDSIDKLSTHNDLLSCHSDTADNHSLNIFSGLGRNPIQPLESLFHTLPEPFLEPRISEASKLFYVGINWERIGRPKGRYHDVLVALDQKDLIEIYGPEEIHGVAPWGGFQTYQGELPFDGHSIRSAINASGMCLALSSAAHKATGIMSNRLFEGLAGGAAVIATPNSLISKYFSDVVYLVDDSRGEAFLGQQIQSSMREIRQNPEEATRRVLLGQQILRDVCSLEKSLSSIFANNDRRKANFRSEMMADGSVTVILVVTEGTLADLQSQIDEFRGQIGFTVDLHIVFNRRIIRDEVFESSGSLRSIVLYPFSFEQRAITFDGILESGERVGPVIGAILETVETDFFAFFTQADRILSEHFATLAKAMERMPDATYACSGSLVRSRDVRGKESLHLLNQRFVDIDSLAYVTGPDHRGRFLFSQTLLKVGFHALMQLLDGEEYRFFQLLGTLDGPLAQTNYATHIVDETAAMSVREPIEAAELQHQFIRDYVMKDGRWIGRTARGGKAPEFIHAYAPGASIRWEPFRSRELEGKLIEIDQVIAVHAGARGVDYLGAGFSHPEAEAVWLAADRGVIEFVMPQRAAVAVEDYEIVLGMAGRRSMETGRLQHCTFVLNNMAVAYSMIGEAFGDVRLKIPLNLLRGTNVLRLELVPDHAEVVMNESGVVIDDRRLSILIRSIAVVREQVKRLPTLEIGKIYNCIDGSPVARAFAKNFYAPEANMTWMCGTVGELAFRTSMVPQKPLFRMKVEGRASQSGILQQLDVAIGEGEPVRFDLPNEAKIIELPCKPTDLRGEQVRVRLSVKHAEPVYNSDGLIEDTRLLGIALLEFGILDARDGDALSGRASTGRSASPFLQGMRKVVGGGRS